MALNRDFERSNALAWNRDDDDSESEGSSLPSTTTQRAQPAAVPRNPPAHMPLIDHLDDTTINEDHASNAASNQPGNVRGSAYAQGIPAMSQQSGPIQKNTRPASSQSNYKYPPGLPPNVHHTFAYPGSSQANSRPLSGPPLNKDGQRQRKYGNRPPTFAPRPEKAKSWGRPEGLVQTRQKLEREEKQAKAAQTQRYLEQPPMNDNYTSIGVYIWPSKTETAMDVLGSALEELDDIKKTFSVWIVWDNSTRCIRILSEHPESFSENVVLIIERIRLAVENSKAQAKISMSLNIIVPPTGAAIRTTVTALDSDGRQITSGRESRPAIASLKLTGPRLEGPKLQDWKAQRPKFLRENVAKFQEHLTKQVISLSPLACWMRMRVSFGKNRIESYRKQMVESKYDFDQFKSMMGESRVTCKFDKNINAAIATRAMTSFVVDVNFKPAEARITRTEDIYFKHTEVIFVMNPSGKVFRIEADLDLVPVGKVDPEYQIGTTRLYQDNARNKRVEVTTVDIESAFDWNFEVVTDNSISNTPSSLQALIDSSVTSKTGMRRDRLGMEYPAVSPSHSHNNQVLKVVVKSVKQYMMKDCGYVLEFTIFREWPGYDTKADPKMYSSVTMSHHRWDNQMESIEGTTAKREWKENLENFFPGDKANGGNGFVDFLDRVRQVRDLLCAAAIGV